MPTPPRIAARPLPRWPFALIVLVTAASLLWWLDLSSPTDSLTVSPSDQDGDEPALAWDGESLWAGYLTYRAGQDRVWLRRLGPGERLHAPEEMSPGPGAYHQPAVAASPQRLWCVWAAEGSDGWNIWGRTRRRSGLEAPVRLSTAPAADRSPALAVVAERFALAWVGPDPDADPEGPTPPHVVLRFWEEDAWSPPRVLPGSRDAWRVALAFEPSGALWVAWDAYRGEPTGYDVAVARVSSNGEVSGPWAAAASERFESHPDLVRAGDDVFIAWQEGSAAWGREGSTNLDSVALHDQRRVRLCRLVAPEQIEPWALPESLATLSEAGNLELPRLAADESGSLLVVARTMPAVKDNSKRYRFVAWHSLAASFDGSPAAVVGPAGRNDQVAAVAGLLEGFAVLQAGDHRSPETAFRPQDPPSWFYPPAAERANRVEWIEVEGAGGAGRASDVARRLEPLSPAAPLPGRGDPVDLGGKTWERYYGDLHRHSDLSRCSANLDGTIEDCYRYAWGPGALDYVALTDHSAHLTAYDWWRLRKAADLYHQPWRGVALFGYERSSMTFGHRNIISPVRDLPLISWIQFANPERDDATATTPRELFARLRPHRGRVITIPHSPAGQSLNDPFGTDWSYHDPSLDRLVEIFQSYRGSYEGTDAPRVYEGATRTDRFVEDGLERGYHLGFIASSDHQSSGGAFAVIYAEGEPTRRSVFEALHARRCYAATARIELEFRVGEHWMGSVLPADVEPRFSVLVRGTAPIARVDIVCEGAVEHSPPVAPGTREVRFDWQPSGETSGETHYYVRVVQVDGEMAWSSPIWVPARSR